MKAGLRSMRLSKKKAIGKIPYGHWLLKNGYVGLLRCKQVHPEFFAHMEQDKRRKTPIEWVKIAEQLATDNGGKLPLVVWLLKNGYNALDLCMRMHPELFEHLGQEKVFTYPDEWLKIAEKEAADNDGILPNFKTLDNKYNGLTSCMRSYPKMFEHFKQEVKNHTPEYWKKLAKKKAKENGGKLQTDVWLRANGLNALCNCMYNHPEVFKGIEQEQVLPDYLAVAKKLCKGNCGVLQGSKWLRNNGHGDLYRRIYNHPELFKGMKQEHRNGVRIIGE